MKKRIFSSLEAILRKALVLVHAYLGTLFVHIVQLEYRQWLLNLGPIIPF